jgi:hypothetical protein
MSLGSNREQVSFHSLRVRALLGRGANRSDYNCQHHGESVVADTEACPVCEFERIVQYGVDREWGLFACGHVTKKFI